MTAPETRCPWCGTDPLYVAYHDTEWGVPQRDPRKMWECLVLESFQSGLSWLTILRKREGFRAAFHGFDPERVAAWGAAEIDAALQDPGIVRHRGKLVATVANARGFLAMESGPGFSDFFWSAVGGSPIINRPAALSDVPSATPLSTRLAKDLKARGFSFCGPKTVYAFMQATGLVNDHLTSCPRHQACQG